MDVEVVYESMFGDTRQVAEAIADGVRAAAHDATVRVMPAREAAADPPGPVDLLIVGGPTHVRRMPSRRTRQMGLQVLQQTPKPGAPPGGPLEPGADGAGVREWLAGLPRASPTTQAAAFDTRIANPLAGGAARSIARRLRRRGYRLAAPPTGFVVKDTRGPMGDGELDRARAWGSSLMRQCQQAA